MLGRQPGSSEQWKSTAFALRDLSTNLGKPLNFLEHHSPHLQSEGSKNSGYVPHIIACNVLSVFRTEWNVYVKTIYKL